MMEILSLRKIETNTKTVTYHKTKIFTLSKSNA